MKPIIVVDDASLPPAKQSTITLRHALGFGAAVELANEWAALRRELSAEPADIHYQYILLTHYIQEWGGPAFAAVGPYSLHALSLVDPFLAVMLKARARVIEHHHRALDPIVQPIGPPVDDPDHEAMTLRWQDKLSARDSRTVAAGRHDALVSLICYGKWTQRQIETEFDPAVLAELLARLDAEARNQDDKEQGKTPPGPRLNSGRTRDELQAEMRLWGNTPARPEVS